MIINIYNHPQNNDLARFHTMREMQT